MEDINNLTHDEVETLLTNVMEHLIELYGRDVAIIITVALEPASDNSTVKSFQWGIKRLLLLLLREVIKQTESQEGDFVGDEGGPATLN